ncbi:TM59L protein, partial [Acromyrmex heyeri]
MTGNMEIFASLVLLVTELTLGDVVNNRDIAVVSPDILNLKDPCNLCENTLTGFPNSSYIKSCCQRGCRFFNLIDSRYKWEEDRLNGTRNACEASCSEAYINPNDRCICNIGCNFMAKQRISDLFPLFTIATCMEKSVDILPTPPDIPENDILTDPGLRKELLPRWWDANGFKLPQTHVKTIPMDTRTVDYTQVSDCSGESKQLASTSKSKTFQRAMKFSFIEYLCFNYIIIASACPFVATIGVAILSYYKKVQTLYKYKFYKNINFSKDIILFMPNEVMMYKISPPKRHDELCSRSI